MFGNDRLQGRLREVSNGAAGDLVFAGQRVTSFPQITTEMTHTIDDSGAMLPSVL